MLHGGNTDKEKLDWLIEHASKVEADLTRQLEEEKGGYRMAIDMLAEERKRVKEKEAQLANQRQYTEDHLLTIEGLRSQLAEAKKIFPIEVHGWKIEPEGEPWALKYNFGPLRASNDGEVINGTLEEILTAIVGQTEDYFYKAIDGYKKSEAELKRSANEREGICKLSESKLLDQLAEAKEANERLSKAVDGFDRNTVRLSSEL